MLPFDANSQIWPKFSSVFFAEKARSRFFRVKTPGVHWNYQAKRLGQPSEVAEAVWEPGLQDGWMDGWMDEDDDHSLGCFLAQIVQSILGGGFKHVLFSPLGKMSHMTNIFQMGGSTTN